MVLTLKPVSIDIQTNKDGEGVMKTIHHTKHTETIKKLFLSKNQISQIYNYKK